MKHIITLLLMAAAITVSAAETPKATATTTAPVTTAGWIASISVAPVGVIKTVDLDGPSQYGAGLDLGVAINPFVSLHVVGLSFEGEGKDGGDEEWGGRLVDEVDVLVKARISRFSNQRFSLFATGGGQYDLNLDDWGAGVGLGAELAFNKIISISGSYTIRSWFKKPTHVDSLVSAQVNFRF